MRMSKTIKKDTHKTKKNITKKKKGALYKINLNNYIIAIPSYKRHDSISNKTLKVLEEQNIDTKRIYIFVANKEEAKLYKNSLDKKYHPRIIVGKPHISNQRNFISSYFSEGTCIAQFDDDVEEIYEMHHPMKKDKDKWNSINLNQANAVVEITKLINKNDFSVFNLNKAR